MQLQKQHKIIKTSGNGMEIALTDATDPETIGTIGNASISQPICFGLRFESHIRIPSKGNQCSNSSGNVQGFQ
jgi:hypothetical protein